MEPVTYIYCRAGVLLTPEGVAEVGEVLTMLAAALDLGDAEQLRAIGSSSITVRGHSPDDTWAAMNRLVPLWKQDRLFLLRQNH